MDTRAVHHDIANTVWQLQSICWLSVHGGMLRVSKSLLQDTFVCIDISIRLGEAQIAKTGLNQGCLLRPMHFGSFGESLCLQT